MKKFSKYISIILFSIMIITSLSIFIGCKKEVTEKKAVIMIPGFMGSLLYDAATNTPVWSVSDLTSLLSQPNLLNTLKAMLTNDENNQVQMAMRPANMNDSEADRYSFNGMFELYYDYFVENYSDEYEILVWQYDWREMNEISAAKLETFINDAGYTDVILIAHSMGGCVVTQYLIKEENREKVDLFISAGTPYLGSVNSASFVINGQDPTADAFFKTIFNVIDIETVSSNLGTLCQLMPCSEINGSPDYSEGSTWIQVDGEYVTNAALYEYLYTLDRLQKSDNTPKPALANLNNYQAANFTLVNGVSTHLTSLVNTEMIVGIGTATNSAISYNSAEGSVSIISQGDGDGTVQAYSATAGRAINDPSVHTLNLVLHGNLVERDASLEILIEILTKYGI